MCLCPDRHHKHPEPPQRHPFYEIFTNSRQSLRVCPSRIRKAPPGKIPPARFGDSCPMRPGQSGRTAPTPAPHCTSAKKRGPKPPLSFAFQAHVVDRPVFFCLRPGLRMGRAHPPRERVGKSKYSAPPCSRPTRACRPSGERSLGKSQTLSPYSSGPVTVAASDPYAPGCRGAVLSYTRWSHHRCCISCRCRCAPVCNFHIHRTDHPRTLASWPWCGRPWWWRRWPQPGLRTE